MYIVVVACISLRRGVGVNEIIHPSTQVLCFALLAWNDIYKHFLFFYNNKLPHLRRTSWRFGKVVALCLYLVPMVLLILHVWHGTKLASPWTVGESKFGKGMILSTVDQICGFYEKKITLGQILCYEAIPIKVTEMFGQSTINIGCTASILCSSVWANFPNERAWRIQEKVKVPQDWGNHGG